MSLWHIAWGYLWNRKFTTFLTVLSVALAVALISSVLTLRDETRKRFEEEGQGFDLVVGAKGSPLQLVLSCVYFMDTPTGNIPLSVYEQLKADTTYVKSAFPIAIGDTYENYRIVGTIPELFEHKWEDPLTDEVRHPFALAQGRIFEQDYEVVIGALVARQMGLSLDKTFISTHGFMKLPDFMGGHDHSSTPYRVVGILKPSESPYDRAIFCNLGSVWAAHGGGDGHHDEDEHHAEPAAGEGKEAHAEESTPEYEEWGKDPSSMVTAVLLQMQSPAMRFQYKEKIRESTMAMATAPIDEVAKLFEQFLGTVKTVLLAVGYLVVVISALSIMIGLYLAILQRKRDLAIMRALGASRMEIFGAVVIEAFWVTLIGIVCGWLLGGAVTYALGLYLTDQYGLSISAFTATGEHWAAFATVALVGLMAGVAPAWQAYRRNVARDLADL